MLHKMNLQPGPFAAVVSGQKTVELRLWDEKRRRIRVGDIIRFARADDPSRTVEVSVTALSRFPDFAALYASFPSGSLGYADGEPADPQDMEKYYSPDEQKKYGVVGIGIRLIEAPSLSDGQTE